MCVESKATVESGNLMGVRHNEWQIANGRAIVDEEHTGIFLISSVRAYMGLKVTGYLVGHKAYTQELLHKHLCH